MKKCFILNCDNNEKNSSKVFISVPRNLEIRRQWYQALGLESSKIYVWTYLYCCEDHFNIPDDFENWGIVKQLGGKLLLKKGVVPHASPKRLLKTVESVRVKKSMVKNLNSQPNTNAKPKNDGHPETTKPSPGPSSENSQLKRKKKCFMLNCANNNRNCSKVFIPIPKHLEIRRQWYQAAGLGSRNIYIWSHSHCCEDHFNIPDDFENWGMVKELGGKLMLKKGVVPQATKRNNHVKSMENLKKVMKTLESSTEKNPNPTPEPGPSSASNKEISDRKLSKKCFMLDCENNDINCSKTFVSVPKDLEIRKQWYQLAGYAPRPVFATVRLYCCEDHFNIPDDFENWGFINHFGGNLVRLKKGVFPRASRKREFDETITNLEMAEPGPSSAPDPQISDSCKIELEDIVLMDPNKHEIEDIKPNIDGFQESSCGDFVHCSGGIVLCNFESNINFDDDPDKNESPTERIVNIQTDNLTSEDDSSDIEDNAQCDKIEHNETVEEKFECHNCGHKTSKKRNLKKHIEFVHLKMEHFECELCDFVAARKQTLTQHIEGVHLKLRKYKCEHCDFRTSSMFQLKLHTNSTHRKIKRFKCELCDFSCATKPCLNNHLKSEHLKLKRKCEFCNFRSTSIENMESHVKTKHENITKLKCVSCDYDTLKKDALDRHIEAKHSNKFKCEACVFSTVKKTLLRKHIQAEHLKLKKFECESCDYVGFFKNSLDRHIKTMHRKEIKCEYCEYTTSHIKFIQRHMKSEHRTLKRFKCDSCGYATSSKSNLGDHIQAVHLKIKRFKCEYCDYAATTRGTRNDHIKRVHSMV